MPPQPPTHSESPSTSAPEYLIRTADLPLSAFDHRSHHVVTTNHRFQVSLGDSTGLTKTGVHFCRLPAGATSTTLHWHGNDDEWMYILDAGEGSVLLIWEPPAVPLPSSTATATSGRANVVPREEALRSGDFLGFKAGVERAHALRAGAKEMVYLLGGSRVPLDVTHYPEAGKRMVAEPAPGEVSWTVEEQHVVKVSGRTAPRPVV